MIENQRTRETGELEGHHRTKNGPVVSRIVAMMETVMSGSAATLLELFDILFDWSLEIDILFAGRKLID